MSGEVVEPAVETLDPRVKRTRALLHEAFLKLVKTKRFEEISVQDLAEAATLNRATFYAHYTDKYALLECVASLQFCELLENRGIRFHGNCVSELRAIVLAVWDFLALQSGQVGNVDALDPHLQAAIVSVVRRMLRDGLRRMRGWESEDDRDMAATATAWALYGAVRDCFSKPDRQPPEQVVDRIYTFLMPLLTPAAV